MKTKLPLTEELDFAYVLSLLPPLHDIPEFSWLPELFSIVGEDRLVTLCKYCGGESIKIPTLDELAISIKAVDWFYKVYISQECKNYEIPNNLVPLVSKVYEVYNARENKEKDS